MQTEINIDGLVGPTHHFGGLGVGNVASQMHQGQVSNPCAAALEGLDKMCRLADLGVPQFYLPPSPRPNLLWLAQIGFQGPPRDQLKRAFDKAPDLLSAAYSSAFMWTANAATVSPSIDCRDGTTHITVANLCSNLHRSQEATERLAMLRAFFANVQSVCVHEPLPHSVPFRDEGAANHMRLWGNPNDGGLEIFVYGSESRIGAGSTFPSRHGQQASQAIARSHLLDAERTFLLEQHPVAIAAGVFHNDVIATSHEDLFVHHELAFLNAEATLVQIESTFAEQFRKPLQRVVVTSKQLSLQQAVASYIFNSQIVSPSKSASPRGMTIFCPQQCRAIDAASRLIQSWIDDRDNPIQNVEFVPLEQSMSGGGGPACLRLRVSLSDEQIRHISSSFALSPERVDRLRSWITKNYPQQLVLDDLVREDFAQHVLHAIDVLYREMNLDFQLSDLRRFESALI